jgi:serine/threonine protein kinase
MLPREVGRYEIISTLGVGGMANVHLAVQRGPVSGSKLLAVKRLRAEMAADEEFLTMFADEARIALRFSHPNIVHTYEIAEEPSGLVMTMEFLYGQALSDVFRRAGRQNIPLDEHLWILTQVLAGLEYAHTLPDYDGKPLNIVHRDVSPSNVIVTYAGEVKLVDFGIAKASGARAETQAGVIKGKIGYASPEQCLTRPVDGRSDVYGVGVMLWEALARRRRSTAETALAALQARLQDDEPPIEEAWPEVPPALAAMTRRALARDPDDRYASALELQRDLEEYLRKNAASASAASVAKLMATYFSEDMKIFRQSIEEYLEAKQNRTPRDVRSSDPTILDAAMPGESSAASDGVSRSGTIPNGTFPRTDDEVPMFRSKRQYPLPALVAVGALALVLGFVVRRALSTPDSPAAAASGAADGTAQAAAPAPAPAGSAARDTGSAASGERDRVRINVRVLPKTAKVRLDGEERPNPFEVLRTFDTVPHELSAQAPGYLSEVRALTFDRDVNLELRLRPAAAGARRSEESAPTKPSPLTASAKATTAAMGAEPGQDLGRAPAGTSRAVRQIDEKDPF